MKARLAAALGRFVLPWLLGCFAALAHAQTLAVPPDLVPLDSDAGERMLLESEARRAFLPLSEHFVTQKTQSYCGVASTAMVLNALGVPAPTTPEYAPYRLFTQDNVLDQATEKILPQAVLARHGTTLDQLGAILESHGVRALVRHASDTDLEHFRSEARDYLSQPSHYVIANFLRRSLGEEKGGHISPIAAYDAKADRFLVMDVSRYKYPPVWVKAAQLFAAMNTADASNGNKSRGFVLVTR